MGSLFSSNEADQTTNQSAVGVQGASGSTSGVGSGTSGTVAANGGIALDRLTASGGGQNVINIQTPDIDAVHAVDHAASLSIQGGVIDTENALQFGNNVALAALSSNMAVSGKSIDAVSGLANESVNAANQLAINALESVHAQAIDNSATTHDAVLAAQALAAQVAPVSEGNIATSAINAETQYKVAIIGGLALIAAYYITKK